MKILEALNQLVYVRLWYYNRWLTLDGETFKVFEGVGHQAKLLIATADEDEAVDYLLERK